MSRYVIFSITWWFGFVLAVLLMITLYFKVSFIYSLGEDIFLIVGLSHMFLLILTGFYSIYSEDVIDNIEVSSRISTMGYLHTLIGTSVALIYMSQTKEAELFESMAKIISPIGSALITSIIGWAFGKEIERDRYRFLTSKEQDIEQSLEYLADKIRVAGLNLEATSLTWQKSINLSISKLLLTIDKFEESITKTNSSLDSSLENSKEFIDSLFKNYNENLQKAVLITEKSFESSSKYSEEFIESLFRNSNQKLEESINLTQKSLENSSNYSKDFMKNIFENINEKIQENINSTQELLTTNLNYSKEFIEENKRLNENFKENIFSTEKSMKDTFNISNEVIEQVSNSMKEILNQLNIISTEWNNQIKIVQNMSDLTDNQIASFFENSKKVAIEVEQVAKTLPSATNIIKEVDELITLLRSKKVN